MMTKYRDLWHWPHIMFLKETSAS